MGKSKIKEAEVKKPNAPAETSEEKPGKETPKPKETVTKVQKTRTDFGGIFLLLLLNGVAYWAIIQHFSDAIGLMREDADELEKATGFILSHWSDIHVKEAKTIVDTARLWHDELQRNLTGEAAVYQRDMLKASHERAMEARELMKKGLEHYKEGKPIYNWEVQYDEEGNLKDGGPEGKYKVLLSDGTVTNDIKIVNRAKDKLAETRAQFSEVRHLITEHQTKLDLIIYADLKAKENKLFEEGMKKITKAAADVKAFRDDFKLETFQHASEQMNKTAQNILDSANLILDSFQRIDSIKAGDKLDLPVLATRLTKIKTMKAELTPQIDRILDASDKTELISAAPSTYVRRSRDLLAHYNMDSMMKQFTEIEKRINLKVRNELKDISSKVDDYSPICMERMDDEDLDDLNKIVKQKDDLTKQFDTFEKQFPNIEQWLKDFHKASKEWIRSMEVELKDLVRKVKGPVAKATRILHKRRSVKSIENDVFERLRKGELKPEHCDDCADFPKLAYKRQMQIVRNLIQEEDERMEKLLDTKDGLTEEEMGIVHDFAKVDDSTFQWKPSDQAARDTKAKELKEELERIQAGV